MESCGKIEEPCDLGEVKFYCPRHGEVDMVKKQDCGFVGVCYVGDARAMTEGAVRVRPLPGLQAGKAFPWGCGRDVARRPIGGVAAVEGMPALSGRRDGPQCRQLMIRTIFVPPDSAG